jgi:hypothetical protein
VIRLTFEGETILDIIDEINYFIKDRETPREAMAREAAAAPAPPEPKTATVVKLEKKPEPKPDAAERMAKARAAKVAKKKAPEAVKPLPQPPPSDPRSSDEAWEEDKQARLEGPDPFDEPEPIDPVNLAALRVKTTEDLQAAYSGGKHKQVMALLSKFGNGAKSFRELQIQDFIPIRKAIDDGALA